MQGFVDDLLDQGCGLFGAFAAAWGILFNPGNAALSKTASPQANRLRATPQLAGDFIVGQTGCGQQRDFGAQHQSSRRRTTARPAFQSDAITI